jgi:hypothetical protein
MYLGTILVGNDAIICGSRVSPQNYYPAWQANASNRCSRRAKLVSTTGCDTDVAETLLFKNEKAKLVVRKSKKFIIDGFLLF